MKVKNSSPAQRYSRFPQVSDLFSDFFDTMSNFDMPRNHNVPAVNVMENDSEFRLEVAAPGLNKDDFKISLDNDIITVSGEKKTETSDKNEKFTRKEFSYTSFQRSFSIPEFVDVDSINANYKDGIMHIVLPKKEEAIPQGPKEIRIS